MDSLLARDHGLKLLDEQDDLDTLSSGLTASVFEAADLHTHFYDLSNGIAGAVMQKFVNYGFPVALVVPADHTYGPRVSELIRDHRTHPCIRFFEAADEAIAWARTAGR